MPATVTFVSPVRATEASPQLWEFLVVQAGGQPLRLEYNSAAEAIKARHDMLSDHVHPVNTWKLFTAIVAALNEAVLNGNERRKKTTGDNSQAVQGDDALVSTANEPEKI